MQSGGTYMEKIMFHFKIRDTGNKKDIELFYEFWLILSINFPNKNDTKDKIRRCIVVIPR